MKASKKAIVVLVILLISVSVYYLSVLTPESFGPYHDDSVYVVMAKAMATGQGYRIISLPGEPPQAKSPPFYLALLSAIWFVDPSFPANLTPMMQLSVLATIAFLAITWLYLVKHSYASPGQALLVVALVALNWRTVILGTGIYSEMVYSALSIGGLHLAEKYEKEEKGWATPVMLSLVIILAFFTRTAGITVVLSVCAYYLLRRRWRRLWPIAIAGLFVALWLGWGYASGAAADSVNAGYYEGYLQTFAQTVRDVQGDGRSSLFAVVLSILAKNAVMLIFVSVPLVCMGLPYDWPRHLPPYLFSIGLGVFVVALIFVAAGFIRHRSSRLRLLHIYIIFYLALHLLWPYTAYDRFVMPLLPFFLLFGMTEVLALLTAVRKEFKSSKGIVGKLVTGVVGLSVTIVIGSLCFSYCFGLTRPLAYSTEMARRAAEDAPAIRWIQEFTDPSDVLLCYRDAMYYLYTARKAARASPMREGGLVYERQASVEEQANTIFRIIDENAARYLILTWTDLELQDQVDPYQTAYKVVLQQYPDIFVPVFKSTDGRTLIYRISTQAVEGQAMIRSARRSEKALAIYETLREEKSVDRVLARRRGDSGFELTGRSRK